MAADHASRRIVTATRAALALAALVALTAAWPMIRPDLRIEGGLIANGLGGEPFRGDVLVTGGTIAATSWPRWLSLPRESLRVPGLVVAPGFIDIHVHVEGSVEPAAAFRPANFLRQGITTLVTGNCGRSAAAVGSWLDQIEAAGTYINIGTLVGHNTLRERVMGSSPEPATPEHIRRLRQLATEAFEEGALGISFGLIYAPGRFADRFSRSPGKDGPGCSNPAFFCKSKS